MKLNKSLKESKDGKHLWGRCGNPKCSHNVSAYGPSGLPAVVIADCVCGWRTQMRPSETP